MSVSLTSSVRNKADHIIENFPASYSKYAQIHSDLSFNPKVQDACSVKSFENMRLKTCKMIVIGDTSVGKTSLIQKFCKGQFDLGYTATIGVDFAVQRFEILNNLYSLQMWDTAGQERFQSIATAYYRGAQIVTIVFDMSDQRTLANAEAWLLAAKSECKNSNLLVFLVGAKKDLEDSQQLESVERAAIKIAKNLHAEYWGVSSKTGENVKEFFTRVAALAFEAAVLRELDQRQNSVKSVHSERNVNIAKDESEEGKFRISCC